MKKIAQTKDGRWHARVTSPGLPTREATFDMLAAADEWTRLVEGEIAKSTVRFGGQREVITGLLAIKDFATSSGVLEDADQNAPSLSERLCLPEGMGSDPILLQPIASLTSDDLVGMRARRLAAWLEKSRHQSPAGDLADKARHAEDGMLVEQAILHTALAKAARRLKDLADPFDAAAADGIRILTIKEIEAAIDRAGAKFRESLYIVLRLTHEVEMDLEDAATIKWSELQLDQKRILKNGRSFEMPTALAEKFEKYKGDGGDLIFPEATPERCNKSLAVIGRQLELGEISGSAFKFNSFCRKLQDGVHPESLAKERQISF